MRHCSIDEKQVRNLYIREGLTQQSIADKLGISRATVSKILIGMGLSHKDRRDGVTIDGVKWIVKKESEETLVLKRINVSTK